MTRVGAVIPAAGRSRRMGRSKPLLPLGESDFVGTLVAALQAPDVGAAPIVVVHRSDDAPLATRLAAMDGVVGVTVPPDDGDMLRSVRVGAAALGDAAGALVWPVDAPGVAPRTVASVMSAARAHPHRVCQPRHEDAPGHPIYVPAPLFQVSPTPDAAPGLRGLLEAAGAPVRPVLVRDPGCLRNVNTPDEYEALQRALARG